MYKLTAGRCRARSSGQVRTSGRGIGGISALFLSMLRYVSFLRPGSGYPTPRVVRAYERERGLMGFLFLPCSHAAAVSLHHTIIPHLRGTIVSLGFEVTFSLRGRGDCVDVLGEMRKVCRESGVV